MNSRRWIFIYGLKISLILSGTCYYYLEHIKDRRGSYTQSSFIQNLETFDHRFNDLKYKWAKKEKTTAPVALVAVDDESIQEIGRWPWGRDIHGQILNKLIQYDVNAIGMDIIYSEPERFYPENDQKLAQIIKDNADKVILGTFSENQVNIEPYQDYCINEAFLESGGDQIVKLNFTLTVDDNSQNLDELNWSPFFKNIFTAIKKKTEADYLLEIGKKNTSQLNQFQKNYIKAKKTSATFDYCGTWLSKDDYIYNNYRSQMAPIYKKLFQTNKHFRQLNLKEQVQKLKSETRFFPVPQYGQWKGNINSLQKSADYTASFVANLDHDGYVRRYPLFYRSGNKLGSSFIPSLALQTYLISKGYRANVKISTIKSRKRIESFQIIDPSGNEEKVLYEVPVDEFGQVHINYYGPAHTLAYISAKDLFSDSETISVKQEEGTNEFGQIKIRVSQVSKREFLKNRALIFGATSTGIYDIRNTPVAANFPGPEIHLTVLANLFDQSFIYPIKNEYIVLPIVLLLIGIVLSFLLSTIGAAYSIISFIIVSLLGFGIDFYIFSELNHLFSSFFIFIEIIFLHVSIIGIKYFSEELKKNEIKKTFSKYVSPDVVNELLENEKNLELGGQKREMSAFFSDVRGFTSFSEKMEPQELSNLLNAYLTPMTDTVFSNKGTLDKYMGDGLMAFFGAPMKIDDHAYYACKCALESMEKLQMIKKEFIAKGWPDINIGIGINTGMMSVGNMGSKIVQSYTILGDAVNLAARLEGATKDYGIPILVGEQTYAHAKGRMVFREVDRVRVKGKVKPIRAYHLVSEELTPKISQWLEDFEQAYATYHQKDFQKALNLLSKFEKKYPDDLVIKLYKKRCQQFIANPPDPTWDGVYERRTK